MIERVDDGWRFLCLDESPPAGKRTLRIDGLDVTIEPAANLIASGQPFGDDATPLDLSDPDNARLVEDLLADAVEPPAAIPNGHDVAERALAASTVENFSTVETTAAEPALAVPPEPEAEPEPAAPEPVPVAEPPGNEALRRPVEEAERLALAVGGVVLRPGERAPALPLAPVVPIPAPELPAPEPEPPVWEPSQTAPPPERRVIFEANLAHVEIEMPGEIAPPPPMPDGPALPPPVRSNGHDPAPPEFFSAPEEPPAPEPPAAPPVAAREPAPSPPPETPAAPTSTPEPPVEDPMLDDPADPEAKQPEEPAGAEAPPPLTPPSDPSDLDAVLKYCKFDWTYAFEPAVVEALARLRNRSDADYLRFAKRLKDEAGLKKGAELNNKVRAVAKEIRSDEKKSRAKEQKKKPRDAPILDPVNPLDTAKTLVAEIYSHPAGRTLHHYRGAFYRWNGASYDQIKGKSVRAAVWNFLAAALENDKESGFKPFKPNTRRVSEVVDALEAAANLPDELEAPCWIGPLVPLAEPPPPALELVACKNGLLHLPSGDLLEPTPAFLAMNSLDIAYDPDASSEPGEWNRFLTSVLADDEVPEGADKEAEPAVANPSYGYDKEAERALQEWFGYCLTPDTSQQKMFLAVGAPRSGKGTIAAILRRLAGKRNVCAPTLSSLTSEFGREPLIDKTLAVVGDARISRRTDQGAIAEILLGISGEDWQTVPRKFLSAWEGQLAARFMFLSNELPQVNDASGALASRFVVLMLRHSFLGKEDLNLKQRLLAELPAILNWAREGYLNLRQRGHFVQPTSSAEAIRQLEALASPIKAFVAECCEMKPGYQCSIDDFFEAWVLWNQQQNNDKPGSKASLGKKFGAAFPHLRVIQPREGDKPRSRYYAGLRIKEDFWAEVQAAGKEEAEEEAAKTETASQRARAEDAAAEEKAYRARREHWWPGGKPPNPNR